MPSDQTLSRANYVQNESKGREKDVFLRKPKASCHSISLKIFHFTAFVAMIVEAGLINLDPIELELPSAVAFPDRQGLDGAQGRVNIREYSTQPLQSLLVTFLVLAGADHLITFLVGLIFPHTFNRFLFDYQSNPLRWIEYSVSASIMSVLISALVGIYDVHHQFLIGLGTGICNLLGLAIEILPRRLMIPRSVAEKEYPYYHGETTLTTLVEEKVREPRHRNNDHMSKAEAETELGKENFLDMDLRGVVRTAGILIYSLATLVLVGGWLNIICYFSQAVESDSDIPDWVYAVFIITIIMYFSFGLNMFFERILGLYGFVTAEYVYVSLSFIAKTYLAW
eukprot:CAMPEP_0184487330 /NCGR_PEP_ID=MMETSP0113_2-20130426/9779_1 /TAXON_ID=91329 /ORGANISM="Norrisiella sphaerica, Strain BC52" /LENGTH=338 /DNA_ID=CAMNT_0026869591 /DNA_START=131 /DNA_END=1144 /DNA_ORIENTATION=-